MTKIYLLAISFNLMKLRIRTSLDLKIVTNFRYWIYLYRYLKVQFSSHKGFPIEIIIVPHYETFFISILKLTHYKSTNMTHAVDTKDHVIAILYFNNNYSEMITQNFKIYKECKWAMRNILNNIIPTKRL